MMVIYQFLNFISLFAWLFSPKSQLTKRIVTMQAVSTLLTALMAIIQLDAVTTSYLSACGGLIIGWMFGPKVMEKFNPNGGRIIYCCINAVATGVQLIILRLLS